MTKEKLFKVVGNMYMSSHILVNTHKTTQSNNCYNIIKVKQTQNIYTYCELNLPENTYL